MTIRRIALAIAAFAVTTSLHAFTGYTFEKSTYTFNESDGNAAINITRVGDLTSATTVTYAWKLSAIVGPTSGTGQLAYGPGETLKTMIIPIPNDGYYTAGMAGRFSLYESAVIIGHQIGSAIIQVNDAQPLPSVSVTDASVVEGNSGLAVVQLHYTMSAPLGKPEDVRAFSRGGGTATSGIDFSEPGFLGQTTLHQTEFDVNVHVHGDTTPEMDETIVMQLAIGPAHGEATITILNDEYLLSATGLRIDRGKTSSLELSTSVPPASVDHIALTSNRPSVASVPAAIDIPGGSTKAVVPITGVSPGPAIVTLQFPPNRGSAKVEINVFVVEQTVVTFEHPTIETTVGGLVTEVVHLNPPPPSPMVLGLRIGNPKIAEIPSSLTIGTDGNGSIPVRGLAVGTTSVPITLQPELGGETSSFGIQVSPPTGVAITSLSSALGPSTGNQFVTLAGYNLRGRCTVTFGSVSALNTAVAANGTITTYTPPHAGGFVDVAVRCGTEEFTFEHAYQYLPSAARLTRIDPASGATVGGTIVTASGENLLRGRCKVWFGDSPATTLANFETSSMAVVAPPHAAGPVTVTLRCDGDASTLNGAFVYGGDEPLAEIAAVSPPSAAPGERVTLGGSGFQTGDAIAFGNAAAIGMTTTPDQHSVTVPEIAAGPVTIMMRDASGRTVVGPSFTVKPPAAPQLTAAPAKVTAGSEIVANGSGFRPSLSFVLAGVPLPSVAVAPTYAVLRVPKTIAPQQTNFALTDAAGATLASRPMEITATGVAVESATPRCVSTDGGALITVRGSGFEPGAVVTFGIADGTEVSVRDAQTIVVRAPASSGVSDATITVINPSMASGQLTGGFQYRWPDSPCGGASRHRPARH